MGRVDKICTDVFVEGGFSAEYGGDPNSFLDARKVYSNVMQQWNGAYNSYVEESGAAVMQRVSKQ